MPPHLIRRKGRPSWYIRDGHKEITTETPKRGLALQILDQYVAGKHGVYRTPHKPVSSFFAIYLKHCATFNKPSTVSDRKRVLDQFSVLSKDPYLDHVKDLTILDYLKAAGLAPSTWNTRRKYLSAFFNWLISQRLLQTNPAKSVQTQKVIRSKVPKALTQKAEARLLRWCWHYDPTLARIAVLAGNTGLRAAEIAHLWKSDVDFKRRVIRVSKKPDWTPKDYEERVIPINQAARQVLRDQILEYGYLGNQVFYKLDGSPDNGRALDRRMGYAFQRAGVTGSLHTLRHTFASRYIEQGGTLPELKDLLGHSKLETTQIYLHSAPDHVKSVADKLKFGTAQVRTRQQNKG
jgi:integrase